MQDQPVTQDSANSEGQISKQKAGLARPIFAFLIPFCLFAFIAWIGRSDEMERYYDEQVSDKEIHTRGWEPTPDQSVDIALWCILCGSTGGLTGLGVERVGTVVVTAIIRFLK